MRPGKPEGLVAAKIGTICTDRADAACVENKANTLEPDLLAPVQGDHRCTSLKRNRPSRCCHHPDDVLMDWQSRIDIAHRKDRTIGVAAVAKVEIPAKRQGLDKNGRFGMRAAPGAPGCRDDAGLL